MIANRISELIEIGTLHLLNLYEIKTEKGRRNEMKKPPCSCFEPFADLQTKHIRYSLDIRNSPINPVSIKSIYTYRFEIRPCQLQSKI